MVVGSGALLGSGFIEAEFDPAINNGSEGLLLTGILNLDESPILHREKSRLLKFTQRALHNSCVRYAAVSGDGHANINNSLNTSTHHRSRMHWQRKRDDRKRE